MDKENDYPLVFIEWQDARGVESDWIFLDDFEPLGTCITHTVGYLIPNPDSSYLTIAQSISAEAEKDRQICGIMYIPTSTILKKHFIKIPEQENLARACDNKKESDSLLEYNGFVTPK